MDSTEEFFAVTENGSVYHVYMVSDGSEAIIEKIAQATTQSDGLAIGTKLTGGYHVGVTNWGLTKYTASIRGGKPVPARLTTTNRQGGTTSRIVALFLDRNEALECVEDEGLHPWDNRWIITTKKTFEAIGMDHSCIVFDGNIPLIHG